MQVIYRNPVSQHFTIAAVDSQVMTWETYGIIISDAAAQAIASWWHSPGNESAALSTAGIVTATMTIDDFADETERESSFRTEEEKSELRALEAYINAKKSDVGMIFCNWCEEYSITDEMCLICGE